MKIDNGILKRAVFAASIVVLSISALIVLEILVSGGVDWRLGATTLFKAEDVRRPLVVLLLSVVCLLGLCRDRLPHVLSRVSPATWLFSVLMVYMVLTGLSGRHEMHGDGREYILQTQSIAFHGRISVDPPILREYWDKTNPYGFHFGQSRAPSKVVSEWASAGGRFGGLYPDCFGRYRYYHFWLYSAVVAPLYGVLHLLNPSGALEYHSFRILNVLFLCIPFVLSWLRRRSKALLVVMLLACFTPLLSYCDWQHPELFCFFFVFLGFWSVESGRLRMLSPLFLGIAACQNIPIVHFFPLHLAYFMLTAKDRGSRTLLRSLSAYVLGAVVAVLPLIYYYYYFGEFSVIAATGHASTEYASWTRVMHMLVSPAIGALWLFPTCFLFLPLHVTRRNVLLIGIMLISTAGAAWLSSATKNFNAGQVGSLRYVVWLMAPLWFMVMSGPWLAEPFWTNARRTPFVLAVVVNILLIGYFRLDLLANKDSRRFDVGQRARPEVAAIYRLTHYHDDREVLAENILGREIAPLEQRPAVIWNLGNNESVWIVPAEGLKTMTRFKWHRGTQGVPQYRAVPAGSVTFGQDGTDVVLDVSKPLCANHHLRGDYVLLWVATDVAAIDTDLKIHIRGAAGEVVNDPTSREAP